MKKSILATILIAMVCVSLVGITGSALADTYTYMGLGGGDAPLSLAWGGGNLYQGMSNGHVWRYDGATWTDLGKADPQGSAVNALCWASYERTDHTYLTTVYAGTASGQVYYYDGSVWGWAGYAGYGYAVTSLVDTGGTTWNVYAGSTSGHVYRCHGGTTWDDAIDAGSSVISLAYGGDHVKAGCANGHVWNGYGTGAGNWTDLGYVGSTNARVVYNSSIGILASCDNRHVYHLVSPNNWESYGVPSGWDLPTLCSVGASIYAGDGYGSVWSYGGGTSWNNTGLPNTAVNGVRAFATDGSDLYVCCANGYTAKDSSGTWSNIWSTSGARVNAVLYTGDIFAGCDNGQVYEYTGTNWAPYGNNIGSAVLTLCEANGRIYAGANDGYIYYYNSGSWTSTSGPGTVAQSLAFDGTALFAGCVDGHIWFYEEPGGWRDGGSPASGWVNALAWTGSNIYAGTQDGEVFRYNGPSDFTSTGLGTSGGVVLSLCWKAPLLYAGTEPGHVDSYDGSNWNEIMSGASAIHSLASNGTTVFTGNDYGMVQRYMGGTSWITSGTAGTSPIEALTWTGIAMWTGSDTGCFVATLTVPPTVTSDAATSISSVGATLNGHIDDTGGENADSRGFRYRKTGAGSWTDWTEAGTFGTGDFSHAITGLDPATDYEYQAGAHNSIGWGYGDGTVTFKTSPSPKPVVASVSPASGPPGTQVTVSGGNFGATQGSSTVTVGGVEASVVSWSGTKIVITVPEGTNGGAVVVTTAQGGSNTDKDFIVVTSTWYLAEGTNAWGFSTYITIENPNNQQLTARLTYMDPNPTASGKGIVGTRSVTLPALSQTTVSSASDIGSVDFSTKVECLQGKTIAVDRTMSWTGSGAPSPEGHSSIGTTAPSTTWYLPEGSSNWGFETWTLLLNPNATDAHVKLTYMIEGGTPQVLERTVPANSRASYNMASDIGSNDASLKVTSDAPVVAERSMYRNNRREGSCSIGAAAPAADFFLAEGATGYDAGFTTYVLVQNPNNSDAQVTLTYQTPSGAKPQAPFTMGANSRRTIKVNDQLPANTNVSTLVHGSRPIIAERAMYWGAASPLGEAMHASIGLDSPHMSFYLPDGQTGSGRETWTLVQNPNPGAVTVRIAYLPAGGGTPVSFTDEIPANSRNTYSMTDKIPSGRASIMVQSLDGARPVMVERAMYWNNKGAGTDTVGGFTDINNN